MTITTDAAVALEKSRLQAMLAGDVAALRQLISPDCSYVHTTGRLDTGQSYLDNLAHGGFHYESLTAADTVVTAHGSTAVVVCRLAARLVIGSEPVTSVMRCTAVWAEARGSTRMIAFQSTSIAEIPTPTERKSQ